MLRYLPVFLGGSVTFGAPYRVTKLWTYWSNIKHFHETSKSTHRVPDKRKRRIQQPSKLKKVDKNQSKILIFKIFSNCVFTL